MPIAAQMAAWGLWPQAFTGRTTVKAAGTTVTDAQKIALSNLTVIQGGTGGVVLPGSGNAGDTMVLINANGAAVNLYPAPTTGKINGGTAAYSIVAAHAATFMCLAPAQWFLLSDVALTGTIPASDGSEFVEEPAP